MTLLPLLSRKLFLKPIVRRRTVRLKPTDQSCSPVYAAMTSVVKTQQTTAWSVCGNVKVLCVWFLYIVLFSPFYFRAAISACYYARLSCLHSQTLAACLMFSDKLNWRLCDGKLRIACSTPDRPEWCRRPSRRPLRWWPSPSQPRSPDPLSPPARAPHRHHCNCRNTQGDQWRHTVYGQYTIAILWVLHGILCGVSGRRFVVLFK